MAKSFTSPHIGLIIMHTVCMSLLLAISFVENASTFQRVPVIGLLLYNLSTNWRFMIQILLGLLGFVHVGEGIYAFYLASSMGMSYGDIMKWTLQTMYMGVLSLNLLKQTRYRNKKKP